MGKVFFEDPVHHISGKISKKFRTIYNYAKLTGLKFTSVRGECTSQPSAKELAIRERFTEVSAMVRTRRKNLNQISQDQLDFIAQKDTAAGTQPRRCRTQPRQALQRAPLAASTAGAATAKP